MSLIEYDENRRLTKEEIRDTRYARGPRLLKNPSLLSVQRTIAESFLPSRAISNLAYDLMKYDLRQQEEHGCGLPSGRCHFLTGGQCPNCPIKTGYGTRDFKCRSEKERLVRLNKIADDLQEISASPYADELVPPQAHGLVHGYRTNRNILRSLIEWAAEEGLIEDFLRHKHGLSDMAAHHAQCFVQRKISGILKDEGDEEQNT